MSTTAGDGRKAKGKKMKGKKIACSYDFSRKRRKERRHFQAAGSNSISACR